MVKDLPQSKKKIYGVGVKTTHNSNGLITI